MRVSGVSGVRAFRVQGLAVASCLWGLGLLPRLKSFIESLVKP